MTAPEEHAASVRDLVAREPVSHTDEPAITGWLQRVCRAASRDLRAMGAGVSVFAAEGEPMPVAAANESSAGLQELQFTMGEGPCIDAYAWRRPVLVHDLSAYAAARWPGYAPAAHQQGVRAVFTFPLQVGAARLGAMEIYRDHTGGLSPEALSRALIFADVAMSGILDFRSGTEDPTDLFEEFGSNRIEVYQAQGMALVQLGVSADEALVRLRAYAYAHDRPIADVARDIVDRKLEMELDL